MDGFSESVFVRDLRESAQTALSRPRRMIGGDPLPCIFPEDPMQISSKQFIAFIVILLFFLFFIGASLIDALPAEQQLSEEGAVCPWCGKTHGDSAAERLLRRFHWLLDSPARLFERLSQSPGRMLSPRLREQSAYAPREYGYII